MKRFLKFYLLTIFLISFSNISAQGASHDYRFTHNDHDTLLIGEISEICESEIVIQSAYFIVSANEIHDPPKKQLQPKTARVTVNRISETLRMGSYVIASLNKDNDSFKVAWGIHEVSSLDPQTLTVSAGADSEYYTNFVHDTENKITPASDVPEQRNRILFLALAAPVALLVVVIVFVAYKKLLHRK